MNSEMQSETVTATAETIIEVSENGPLLIYGNVLVKDALGHETKKNKVTAFCRCGQSGNKPYCDGTHNKIEFRG
jgi:CDGSH-type Zn-finger protein